jgi:sugar/nucleoside kinase (ribokinase family)
MPSPVDVVVLGDSNPDLVLHGDVTPAFGQAEQLLDSWTLTIGGSGAIFAAGAARLGLRVGLVAVMGDDALGGFQLEALRVRDVDVSGVIIDAVEPTGLSVLLSRGEDRSILTGLGTIAALASDRIDRSVLAVARHIHVSSYFLQHALHSGLPELLTDAQAQGITTSLDPNWDPSGRWNGGLAAALPHLDYLLLNGAEVCHIARSSDPGRSALALARAGPAVIVKLGADGTLAASEGEILRRPAVAVEVIETTGAGDSFDAGFVTGILRGESFERSLELACACGSLSCRAVGIDAQPTLDEARAALIGP